MKRYTDKTYHDLKGMARTAFAEENDGEWVEYNESQKRENKLIDMIYKSNTRKWSNFFPDAIGLEPGYKYIHENCDGTECKQCYIDMIKKMLDELKT